MRFELDEHEFSDKVTTKDFELAGANCLLKKLYPSALYGLEAF